jgi:hypothetical protein
VVTYFHTGYRSEKYEGKEVTWEIMPTDSTYTRWRLKFTFLTPKARTRRSWGMSDLPTDIVILEGWGHPDPPSARDQRSSPSPLAKVVFNPIRPSRSS